MHTPKYLKAGDEIRIISTARKISKEELQPTLDRLSSWGLKVSFGKNLFGSFHQFSGTAEERAKDLQEALDDSKVKAILCARGGYGSVQIVDQIDFSIFIESPKWLIGYSDVTVLHNHINQNLKIETLHAIMPINFKASGEEDVAAESLKQALFGKALSYEFQAEASSILNFETVNAPVFGGNLSILYSLTGTASQLKKQDYFLFMEDLDEYLYHIDRMMMNLKRAGYFEHCKGVLVGGMTDMNDNTIPYGLTAKQIIVENLKSYQIPVVFGVPAGHIEENLALIMGRVVELKNENGKIQMSFHG